MNFEAYYGNFLVKLIIINWKSQKSARILIGNPGISSMWLHVKFFKLRNFTSTIFSQKFPQSSVLQKNFTINWFLKRKKFTWPGSEFLIFPQCVSSAEFSLVWVFLTTKFVKITFLLKRAEFTKYFVKTPYTADAVLIWRNFYEYQWFLSVLLKIKEE